MSASLGIFSFSGMLAAAQWTRCHPKVYLKRAALFFDHIVMIPSGVGDVLPFDQLLSTVLGLEIDPLPEVREIFLQPEELGAKTNEACEQLGAATYNYLLSDQERHELLTQALEAVVATNSSLDGAGRWEAYKKLYSITQDLTLPALFLGKTRCFSPIMTEVHKVAFNAVRAVISTNTDDEIVEAFGDAVLPDWGELGWNNIAKARKSTYLASFRKVVGELQHQLQGPPTPDIASAVRDRLVEAAVRLAADVEPSPLRSGLLGVIGNLPTPILVNPVGIAAAAVEVRKATKVQREYGWLFLLSGLDKHERPKRGNP